MDMSPLPTLECGEALMDSREQVIRLIHWWLMSGEIAGYPELIKLLQRILLELKKDDNALHS